MLKPVFDWTEKAESILSGKTNLGIDELLLFAKTGETLPLPRYNYIVALRTLYRDAVDWIAEYENSCGTDDGSGNVVGQDLTKLQNLVITSSHFIGVNLTEYTNYIEVIRRDITYWCICYFGVIEYIFFQRLSQVYCICRLQTPGNMIACDKCPEWYHTTCVGICGSQVIFHMRMRAIRTNVLYVIFFNYSC